MACVEGRVLKQHRDFCREVNCAEVSVVCVGTQRTNLMKIREKIADNFKCLAMQSNCSKSKENLVILKKKYFESFHFLGQYELEHK
jgi:hypothetical protein